MRTGLTVVLAWTLAGLPMPAAGDGGTLRVTQPAGPFTVAVFSTPEPLRVGPVDLSVLVLDRTSGRPVLDAAVSMALEPPSAAGAAEQLDASHAAATNKLLYAASFTPAVPGDWMLHVIVRRASDVAEVHCPLPVSPDRSVLADVWPYLALPPVAVALYALRAWLVSRRRPSHGSQTVATAGVAESVPS